MSIIGELRKISGDNTLQWLQGGCPHVNFKLLGRMHTLVRRTHGYQLNVEGERKTPWFVTDTWPIILKRLRGKISSQIVK